MFDKRWKSLELTNNCFDSRDPVGAQLVGFSSLHNLSEIKRSDVWLQATNFGAICRKLIDLMLTLLNNLLEISKKICAND